VGVARSGRTWLLPINDRLARDPRKPCISSTSFPRRRESRAASTGDRPATWEPTPPQTHTTPPLRRDLDLRLRGDDVAWGRCRGPFWPARRRRGVGVARSPIEATHPPSLTSFPRRRESRAAAARDRLQRGNRRRRKLTPHLRRDVTWISASAEMTGGGGSVAPLLTSFPRRRESRAAPARGIGSQHRALRPQAASARMAPAPSLSRAIG
jgi:hypothetical protein